MRSPQKKLGFWLLIALLLVLVVSVWLLRAQFRPSSNGAQNVSAPSPSAAATLSPVANVTASASATVDGRDARAERKEQEIKKAYLTPIAVFGKVLDENGTPLPGATVQIGVSDKPLESSQHTKITDDRGEFSLTGVHGIAFSLRASKAGYYTIKESRAHRNVVTPGPHDAPQPSVDQPVVLVVRKRGSAEPLVHVSSRQVNVLSTGQPVMVDLGTGGRSQGDLQIASWIDNNQQKPYDWRYKLSVPSGGLVERTGPFDFEAPVEGYQPTAEIAMLATAEKWSARAEKEYFVKLVDNRFARFSIRLYPGSRNYVVIESYMNPTPGSRNLEFDASNVVRSPP